MVRLARASLPAASEFVAALADGRSTLTPGEAARMAGYFATVVALKLQNLPVATSPADIAAAGAYLDALARGDN